MFPQPLLNCHFLNVHHTSHAELKTTAVRLLGGNMAEDLWGVLRDARQTTVHQILEETND